MAGGAREKKEARKLVHGWFVTPDRPGDRTLEQQMTGLGPLLAEVEGKTLLDVGCAEGLISIECARAGAASTFGFDYFEWHLPISESLAQGLPCKFARLDANEWNPPEQYDIVLLLAVLHKLKDPTAACEKFAGAARDLCVIRLSPDGTEIIKDGRSRNVPHDIGRTMRYLGFAAERSELGPLGEVTWYYRRQKC